MRPEVCTLTQKPQDGATRVKERQAELEALLRRSDDELPRHPSLRIEDESLVVGLLHAEDKPHSLVALEALINARLPLVELPDLLMEVDGWTGFSRHLEHAGGAEPRTSELLVHCHASILAQACNFGLTRMAQLADGTDFLHCAFEGGNLFLGQIATQVKRCLSKGFFVQWFRIDNHTVQIKKNGLQVVHEHCRWDDSSKRATNYSSALYAMFTGQLAWSAFFQPMSLLNNAHFVWLANCLR